MTDIFYEFEDSTAANYADGITPYSWATDVPSVALRFFGEPPKY